MSDLERHTIAIPQDLFAAFDKRNRRKGYKNRSEAIRDLIRESLVEEEWGDPEARVAATVTLVYDHHTRTLSAKLTDLQHDYSETIVSSVHVHLDHHNCLEVLVLRGKTKDVRKLADLMGCIKGVKHAQLTLTAEGKTLH
jgi:CopG family transcriptional regulator, nickel-responsive regulator